MYTQLMLNFKLRAKTIKLNQSEARRREHA